MVVSLNSCTSEYEERLEEAKRLKERLSMIEESNFISPNSELIKEMRELEAEIDLLARVSGNEEMFFADLEQY
jgi:hypothetical protein